MQANFKASRRIIFSANITYSTGRPITYPVSKYQQGEQVFLQYSKYNQYRISDYFRIDVSAMLNGNLKKNQRVHSSLTLSFYNLTAGTMPIRYTLKVRGKICSLSAFNIWHCHPNNYL